MVDKSLLKDSLYDAVNGDWEKTAEIDPDKTSTGGFNDLADNVEKILMEDAEKFASGQIAPENELEEEYVKYHKLVNDFDRREAEGTEPVKPVLEKIHALNSLDDLVANALDFSREGLPLPFNVGVAEDLDNAREYGLHLSSISTFLPDTPYYDDDNESGKQLLGVFSNMLTQLLPHFGYSAEDTDKIVAKALAFDSSIVPYIMSREEQADMKNLKNPRTLDEIAEYSDKFNLKDFIVNLLGQEPEKVNIYTLKFFENFDRFVNDDTFENLKAWLLVQVILGSTSLLSEEIRQIGGQYNLVLTGQPELRSQKKAAFYLAKNRFSQVVGNYYGEQYFGPEAREDVRAMVETMKEVYIERLQANEWIQNETAEKAIEKVRALDVLVGYPDEYPARYSDYKVDESLSVYENAGNINKVDIADNLNRFGKEVDKTEWGMPADMVNAYFNPTKIHICFPAAILQEPFYSLDQSTSANYGGIGAVMGHEISHAFDNNGALFDANGNMANWWTDEDYAAFGEKTQLVIDQYEGLELAEGKVNGKLTVSENIADLAGLTVALESLQQEDDYSLTDFFENWARVWRQKSRPEYTTLLLQIDVHAPTFWRANQTPQNLNLFHETYGTEEGDKMYLAPEDRITIW